MVGISILQPREHPGAASPWGLDIEIFGARAVNGHFRNRLIGGTDSIYMAYFLGLCKGISLENMKLFGVIFANMRKNP